MTYDEAMDESTTISIDAAKRELARHDCEEWHMETRIGKFCFVDDCDGSTFASADENGEVFAADILGWLGY